VVFLRVASEAWKWCFTTRHRVESDLRGHFRENSANVWGFGSSVWSTTERQSDSRAEPCRTLGGSLHARRTWRRSEVGRPIRLSRPPLLGDHVPQRGPNPSLIASAAAWGPTASFSCRSQRDTAERHKHTDARGLADRIGHREGLAVWRAFVVLPTRMGISAYGMCVKRSAAAAGVLERPFAASI